MSRGKPSTDFDALIDETARSGDAAKALAKVQAEEKRAEARKAAKQAKQDAKAAKRKR